LVKPQVETASNCGGIWSKAGVGLASSLALASQEYDPQQSSRPPCSKEDYAGNVCHNTPRTACSPHDINPASLFSAKPKPPHNDERPELPQRDVGGGSTHCEKCSATPESASITAAIETEALRSEAAVSGATPTAIAPRSTQQLEDKTIVVETVNQMTRVSDGDARREAAVSSL
ncbi:unnamed protein product, partial [Sphacelaria rigidula]